jgi:very-short-patch-repair endonuclease
MHQGVYLVGPGPPSRKGFWLAAVLAAGQGALLAGKCAAALHGIHLYRGSRIDVVIPYGRNARIDGVRIHRSRRLHPDDHYVVEAIPVTSPERTLVDLAAALSPGDLKRAYERAEELRIVDHLKLGAAVERSANAPRIGNLRELLGYDPAPINEARAELEKHFYRVVTNAGLPPYSRNVVVEGFEVDAYWPGAALVVELQGCAYHSDRETFIRDHRKNAALQAAGNRVLPVTDDGLRRPAELVATLRKLLAVNGSER